MDSSSRTRFYVTGMTTDYRRREPTKTADDNGQGIDANQMHVNSQPEQAQLARPDAPRPAQNGVERESYQRASAVDVLHVTCEIAELACMAVVIQLSRTRARNRPCSEKSLDEQALAYVKKNGATSVTALFDALKARNPSLTDSNVADLVWRLAEEGKVDLEDVPPAAESLGQYLRLWERNLWFYAAMVISLSTMFAIYLLPEELPLVAVRWVLGSVFVLFVPGYVTVEALFPKGRDLDSIERFALSVGLSLALVPLIGLLLNYTPWGIRLTPIVISLTTFTVGIALIALARQYRMSVERAQLDASVQQ